MSQKQTRVIAIANQKGGVGKTTNTIHIAAGLAERGRKCLIIDLDASAGATKTLGAPLVGWNTTYELMTGEAEPLDAIITDHDEEVRLPKNIHLIPASTKLGEIDTFLNSTDNLGVVPQDLLIVPIRQLRGSYDYILLDSPPLVTKTTFPSYKAADYVILSTQLEKLSVEALEAAMKLVASAKRHGNPQLMLLGVVESMVPQPLTRLAQFFRTTINQLVCDEQGRPLRFDVTLHRHVAIQEAATAKQTLFEYEPTHKAVEHYRKLAAQIEERIHRIESLQVGQGITANG
jgi:chromosome partitioning protein